MEIPKYFIAQILRHYRLLVENATFPPTDHKMRDTLRIARKEIARLDEMITRHTKQHEDD